LRTRLRRIRSRFSLGHRAVRLAMTLANCYLQLLDRHNLSNPTAEFSQSSNFSNDSLMRRI
jgi:hypothetical protein